MRILQPLNEGSEISIGQPYDLNDEPVLFMEAS
jgi:hypothetical protein